MPCSPARHKSLTARSWRPARCAGLVALLLLLTTEGLQNAAADGETRTLRFHHTHTGEDITITYKKNGRYDEAALEKLNRFLRDWRNDAQTKMDPRLFDVVWEVYQDVDGKQPIQIISAYRSPETNAMLRRRSRGVAKFSQHMLGKAMDFNIPGVPLEDIRIAGLRLQRGGVGFYPSSGSPFVHLDIGSVRHWPRMTHDQLVRVFPNGRTVHIPSDGKPLPGYALALADIQRRGSSPPSEVSVAAAREAGVPVESGGKRSLFARLFGFGGDEEDDDLTRSGSRTLVKTEKVESANATPSTKRLASAVPLPRARPSAAAEPLVAAVSKPKPASSPRTAAEIVEARGLWHASEMLAAISEPPPRWEPWSLLRSRAARRQQPQQPAVVVKGTTTVVAKSTASARREAAAAIATAGTDITGSLPLWLGGAPPGANVFAYAAEPPAEDAAPAAPMGTFEPVRPHQAKREPAARNARPLAANRPLSTDPWLRAMIAAGSIHSTIAVTVIGVPDYRAIAPLLRKPRFSVLNAFSLSDAAPFDLDPRRFRGAAVSFVPVMTFPTVTAELLR
ncbi:MAG TPA: DUF882 domain-containing protein [Xanthobacteraceae bacterium]|nr:DUF882 domain-containing protein [Xanthobacteraceae bacterium]